MQFMTDETQIRIIRMRPGRYQACVNHTTGRRVLGHGDTPDEAIGRARKKRWASNEADEALVQKQVAQSKLAGLDFEENR